MSRRLASRWTAPIVAGLASLAVAGCGGGKKEAPEPQAQDAPVAAAGAADVAPQTAAPVVTPQPPQPSADVTPPVETSAPMTAPDAAAPPAEKPAVKAAAPPADQPVDALKWLQDSEARRADYTRRIAETEADLAVANASVKDWERTVLEFKNPFLARPQLSPEDAQTIKGMDGKARVQWAEGRLDTARTARDAVQKKLDDLKANPPQS